MSPHTDAGALLEAVTDELLAHGEFSSGANNRSNARIAAEVVINMVRQAASHGSATVETGPVTVNEYEDAVAAAQARQEPSLAQIDSAAQYLVATVERVLWGGLRTDGRASDDGFEPFHSAQFTYAVNGNARQEDYRDVIREIEKRLGAPSVPSADREAGK